MSTKTLKEEKRHVKSVMFSQKCLGIVLKRIPEKGPIPCYAVCLKNGECSTSSTNSSVTGDPNAEDWMFESGYLIFQDFQEENRHCYWNQALVDSVNNVEFMGFVAPGTLLIGGNEYYLEGIRTSWARRVLKPPVNYVIMRLGDVSGMDIQVIAQVQFTPLPEALCLVISELNQLGETASLPVIFSQLQERFNDMIVPNEDIIYSSLGKLIKDRKIYHTGDGYFIVTPETYRLTTMSPLPERPILMTNEEAMQKLHGTELRCSSSQSSQKTSTTHRSRSIQANMDDVSMESKSPERTLDRSSSSPTKMERFGSMRLSRKGKSEDEESFSHRRGSLRFSPERSKSLVKDINLKTSPVHQDVDKGEKVSVFHKLFRRSSSKRRKGSKSPIKYSTFAAQFPPPEWSDPNCIHFHSRATQTMEPSRTSKDKTTNSLRTLPTVHQDSTLRPELRSKADSLSRLRDHEKRQHRLHSLDSPRAERQSRIDSKDPVMTPSRSSQKSSSVPRRSVPLSSTPDSSPSPKKIPSGSNSPQHTGTLTKSERRQRRAESCVQLQSTRDRSHTSNNIPTTSASPEKQRSSLPRQSEESRLNNMELRSDEEYRVSDSFGSSFANNASSPPKNKVAPYRIVPTSSASSARDKPVAMNNASGKPSGIPTKVETPTTIKCVNKLNSPGDKQSSTSVTSPSNRLSTCSNISLSPTSTITDGSEFDVAFSSLTAQKLLKGVSINSIDTLIEVNMAAEKASDQNKSSNEPSKPDSMLNNSTGRPPAKQLLTSCVTLTYSGKSNNTQGQGVKVSSQDVKPVNNSASDNSELKISKLNPNDAGETKVLGIV